MKKLLKGISLSLLLRAIAVVLSVIPIIYVAGHMATVPAYTKTLIFIPLAVLAEVLTVIFARKSWCDFLHVAGAVFMALAFASFMQGGVLSIADYIAGINLFGDSTQVPAIITYGIILFCGTILSIIDCFICDEFLRSSGNQIKIIKEKE